MKSKIPSIFIVALVALFGCGPANAADDYFDTLTKLAEQGDASAQFKLGLLYKEGLGVPQDDAEAVNWYRKAAEQGHADAQFNLGVKYAGGRGVPEDYAMAYAWFNVAAASGDETTKEPRNIIKKEMTPSQIEKGQALAREIFDRIQKRKQAAEAVRKKTDTLRLSH